MNWKRYKLILMLLLGAGLISGVVPDQPCLADETIKGHYCYTYGDNESLREARELTRTLAIRNAIESYRVFIESTSSVKNFQLTSDIVQMLSSGYLKNVKVIEHTEKGRTACDTIQATVSPQAVENIIKREVRKRAKKVEEIGLDNNGYLKILKVWKNPHGVLMVVAKALRNLSYPPPSGRQDCICIDFYDVEGIPIGGGRSCAISTGMSMLAGEIRGFPFSHVPSGSASWRVWLPK